MSPHARHVVLRIAWSIFGLAASMGDGLSQTPPRIPEGASQNDCAMAAFDEYSKRALAIEQQKLNNGLRPTVEFTLQQRRIQEQFCLRFVRCLFPDWSNNALALQGSLAFDSCLRNEAHEQLGNE